MLTVTGSIRGEFIRVLRLLKSWGVKGHNCKTDLMVFLQESFAVVICGRGMHLWVIIGHDTCNYLHNIAWLAIQGWPFPFTWCLFPFIISRLRHCLVGIPLGELCSCIKLVPLSPVTCQGLILNVITGCFAVVCSAVSSTRRSSCCKASWKHYPEPYIWYVTLLYANNQWNREEGESHQLFKVVCLIIFHMLARRSRRYAKACALAVII